MHTNVWAETLQPSENVRYFPASPNFDLMLALYILLPVAWPEPWEKLPHFYKPLPLKYYSPPFVKKFCASQVWLTHA